MRGTPIDAGTGNPNRYVLDRRGAIGLCAAGLCSGALALSGCTASAPGGNADAADGRAAADEPQAAAPAPEADAALPPLPPAHPDPESPFGVDTAINMDTIDDYLNRDDVVYRDMRLFKDPAQYEAIGGNADLDITLEGFKVVPWPLIGTLQELPVDGAYDGDTLFNVKWGPDGEIVSATPNYLEAETFLEEVFPKDKAIFLICGGAGYAGMMRKLLVYLGWDPEKVYNVGGAWDYAGYHPVELISYLEDDKPSYHLWRADTVNLDFQYFTPVA